jgi:uncharacterized damage-inducible protein DinB
MHARLAEAMDYAEEMRQELLRSLAGIPKDRMGVRPSLNEWSVAEIVEHLRVVEGGIARLVAKRVGQAREAGLRAETSSESVLGSLDAFAATLEGPIDAPATVRPRSNADFDEAMAGLDTSRQALRLAAASADGLAIGEIKHTHPTIGELDLYQWLVFIGKHEARHTRQVARTLRAIAGQSSVTVR